MKNYTLLFVSLFMFSLNINSQNIQWAKRFDTRYNSSFYASTIKLDAQNNIIVAGLFRETIDFDLGIGVFNLTPSGGPNLDIFIAKYTPTGDFVWAKQISGHDFTQLWDFTIDKSSNIILSGLTNDVIDVNPSTSVRNIGVVGSQTSFVLKYSPTGSLVWANTFSSTANFLRVRTDSKGKIIIAGTYSGAVDFDPSIGATNFTAPSNNTYLFISKYNAGGTLSWVKSIGDPTNFSEDVYDVHIDSLDNIFIGGRFSGTIDMDPGIGTSYLNSNKKYVGYFAKYTSSGSFIMARSFNSTGNSQVRTIRTDKSGDIVISGKFNGTTDLDASSATLNVSATATFDVFLTKYTSSGMMKWGFDLGNASEETLTNHEISKDGTIYLFGKFKSVVDFNPSTTVTNLTSLPGSQPDLYFASYDSLGLFKNALKLGGNKAEDAVAFTLNKSGELCLFGNFAGTVDFDFTSATTNLVATDQDFFMAKYVLGVNVFKNATTEESSIEPTTLAELETTSFSVFPNPVNDYLQLKLNDVISSITIYNTQGISVIDTRLEYHNSNESPYILNVNDLPSGVYELRVNNTHVKTFIKQ